MPRHLPKRNRTVLVDIGRGAIKLAVAEPAGEAARFHSIARIELPDDVKGADELDDTAVAEMVGHFVRRHGWGGLPAAALLSRSSTSTQSFHFPKMPDNELRDAISLKLADTLHFDVDDAYHGYRRVSEPNGNELALVVAARKDAVHRAIGILRRSGLRPVAIGAAGESIANLAQHTLVTDGEATVHVDLSAHTAIVNMFEGRLLRFSREVALGGEAFTQALMRPIITSAGPVQLTRDQAEEVKVAAGCPSEDREEELPHGLSSTDVLPLLEPVWQQLATELRRSMDYLRGMLGAKEVDRVVLSGSGAAMKRLNVVLQEILGTPVVCIDPVARALAHWRLAICDAEVSSTAGFSAILGYSLGNHRAVNLMPREEVLEEVVEKVSSLRRALVPTGLAFGASLAIAAIPLQRVFDSAAQRMEDAVVDLDARLEETDELRAQADSVRAELDRVSTVRGPVPEWTQVFMELSAVLPDTVQLEELSVVLEDGRQRMSLDARVHPSIHDDPVTATTRALGESPYFGDVRVIDASAPNARNTGHLEVTFQLLAPTRSPRIEPR